jgi:hypothetical protein
MKSNLPIYGTLIKYHTDFEILVLTNSIFVKTETNELEQTSGKKT